MFFKRTNNDYPVQAMYESEMWVNRELVEKYGWPISRDIVERKLNLIIEEVEMDGDIEAQLVPDDTQVSNGRIQLNKQYIDEGEFEYIHEVIHYVEDVKAENRVSQVYTRRHSGNGSDPHEQEIDYRAAAALAPANKVMEDINRFRSSCLFIDQVSFMRELQKKYSCSEQCLARRFREVHKLRRHKMLPIPE